MVTKAKPTAELGTTGLNRFGGTVVEEFLTDLRGTRGLKIYDEMRKNDAIVGGILFAIEMALREVNWTAEQTADSGDKGKEAVKFVNSCMRDMSHTWSDFICDALLMLPFGFSYFEIVYKQRDGENSKYNDNMIGWRKFGYRSPDSLYGWEFDDSGGVTAFLQQSAPSYQVVRIPIEKSIFFRTSKEKNNPEGISVLRNMYMPWYYRKNLQSLEGISLERTYAGFPIVKLPKGASTGGGANSDEAKAKDLVRKVRIDEQMGIVLPDGWDFKLLGPEGRGIDAFNTSIIRYRQEMMVALLTTFIALGIEKAGSYALARETRDFFQIALSGWLNNIAETLNEFAVPKLLKLNDFDQWLVQLIPGKVGQFDLDKLSNYISRLAMVGAIQIDEPLERFLREAGNLPPPVKQLQPAKPEIPKIPENTTENPAEVGKAEGWHPSLAKKPGLIRDLKSVEDSLEAETRKFFRLQAEWIDRHWEDFLPKSKSNVLKGIPKDWEAWIPEFVKWILPSLGKAMVLGADTARSDLPGIMVDWSLQNPKALEFIREHGLKLAKTINQTTQEQLRATLLTGMELGENKAALVARIKDVMTEATDFRARLIAQNETMTAYNTGSLQLYQEGGVKQKRWLAGQENACSVCQGLDGTTVDIDDDFDAEQFGMVASPPGHVGCRCSLRGVVE